MFIVNPYPEFPDWAIFVCGDGEGGGFSDTLYDFALRVEIEECDTYMS